MPWFKVDDKLHDHRKTRAAKKAAMGVWVLAGSWCADHLTDGFVPASVLSRWGTSKDAAALVSAELWDPAEQDGEAGWRFRNWPEFQPSRTEVEAERAATRERVKRWRDSRRNTVTPDVTNEDRTGAVRSPRPDPTRPDPSLVQSSTHLTLVGGGLADDDLDKIRAATGGDRAHAATVAADVLARSTTPPRNPVAYVLRAVGEDPGRYKPTKRNVRTSGEECPTHAGQFAAACNGCAADRKAAR